MSHVLYNRLKIHIFMQCKKQKTKYAEHKSMYSILMSEYLTNVKELELSAAVQYVLSTYMSIVYANLPA